MNKKEDKPAPVKRLCVRSLKKAEDVRRLLGRLIRARLAGDIDTDTLRAVTYTSSILLKALETDKRNGNGEVMLPIFRTNFTDDDIIASIKNSVIEQDTER